MSENYHGRIMNIRHSIKGVYDFEEESRAYKEGHRDARHAAAEIAIGADSTIITLKSDNARLQSLTTEQAAEIERLRGAGRKMANACFNLSQWADRLPEGQAKILDDLYREWDEALTKGREG